MHQQGYQLSCYDISVTTRIPSLVSVFFFLSIVKLQKFKRKIENCVCKIQVMPPCPKPVLTPCPILTHDP